MPGKLILIPTPIGNLEDITLRAQRLLRECDAVVAEDTRVTGRLLQHYGIRRPLVPYHEHNAERERPRVLQRLSAGGRIALISDAGTPLISDPGYKLIRDARAAGHAVWPVPGPSAPKSRASTCAPGSATPPSPPASLASPMTLSKNCVVKTW